MFMFIFSVYVMGWNNHQLIEGLFQLEPSHGCHESQAQASYTHANILDYVVRLSKISLPNKLYHTIHGIKCH